MDTDNTDDWEIKKVRGEMACTTAVKRILSVPAAMQSQVYGNRMSLWVMVSGPYNEESSNNRFPYVVCPKDMHLRHRDSTGE